MWDSIPPELFDGNTYACYNFATNVTKDAENRISQVEDLSGNLRHLLQATTDAQPLWSIDDGAIFDGIDDYMQSTGWNLPKPTTVYVVVRRTILENTFYFDGAANNQLYFGSYSPQRPKIRSGASSVVCDNIAGASLHIFSLKFNGADSFVRLYNVKNTGTTGSTTATGLTIGASPDFSVFGRMIFKEIIIRNVSDSLDTENAIMDSLMGRY